MEILIFSFFCWFSFTFRDFSMNLFTLSFAAKKQYICGLCHWITETLPSSTLFAFVNIFFLTHKLSLAEMLYLRMAILTALVCV